MLPQSLYAPTQKCRPIRTHDLFYSSSLNISKHVYLLSTQQYRLVSLLTVCRHSVSQFRQPKWAQSTEHKHSPNRCISLTAAAPAAKQSRLCLFVYLFGHSKSETKFRQLTAAADLRCMKVSCLKWCISLTGHHAAPLPLKQTNMAMRSETEYVGGKPGPGTLLDILLECEVDDSRSTF